jgi:hypothetical protein
MGVQSIGFSLLCVVELLTNGPLQPTVMTDEHRRTAGHGDQYKSSKLLRNSTTSPAQASDRRYRAYKIVMEQYAIVQ